MPGEAEKRLHRCCFTGHRPEKLDAPEETVKAWLQTQIRQAFADDRKIGDRLMADIQCQQILAVFQHLKII